MSLTNKCALPWRGGVDKVWSIMPALELLPFNWWRHSMISWGRATPMQAQWIKLVLTVVIERNTSQKPSLLLPRCALSASSRKKVYVKWIRRSHRIYSHHTRGTNVAEYWTHYRYKLLLIKFLTNVAKVIVGMTSKAHFLHHFSPRVILLCSYREPQPHKTQKAPHNKPQTPSTENPNPKT